MRWINTDTIEIWSWREDVYFVLGWIQGDETCQSNIVVEQTNEEKMKWPCFYADENETRWRRDDKPKQKSILSIVRRRTFSSLHYVGDFSIDILFPCPVELFLRTFAKVGRMDIDRSDNPQCESDQPHVYLFHSNILVGRCMNDHLERGKKKQSTEIIFDPNVFLTFLIKFKEQCTGKRWLMNVIRVKKGQHRGDGKIVLKCKRRFYSMKRPLFNVRPNKFSSSSLVDRSQSVSSCCRAYRKRKVLRVIDWSRRNKLNGRSKDPPTISAAWEHRELPRVEWRCTEPSVDSTPIDVEEGMDDELRSARYQRCPKRWKYPRSFDSCAFQGSRTDPSNTFRPNRRKSSGECRFTRNSSFKLAMRGDRLIWSTNSS